MVLCEGTKQHLMNLYLFDIVCQDEKTIIVVQWHYFLFKAELSMCRVQNVESQEDAPGPSGESWVSTSKMLEGVKRAMSSIYGDLCMISQI